MKQITKTRSAAWSLLPAACLCLIPAADRATAATITQLSGDDMNTSVTVDPMSGNLVYSCPWVTSSLPKAGFTTANCWRFTYAGAASAAFLQTDLAISSYYPWVTNQPTYTNGLSTWGGNLNGEAGGAYIQLTYTPRPGTNDPTNVTWVQAVASSYWGSAIDVHLDNPFNRASPFYFGPSYAAGKTFFVDIPGATEREYENNPVASADFQVFLAQDFGARNGVQHDVTLYGGYWWGYRYSATDTPELGTMLLAGSGLFLLGLYRRRKAAMRSGTD